MIAKQTIPTIGVRNISRAGFIEMKVMETPARAPSKAAFGVMRRMMGAMKPPAIKTKL